MDYQEIQMQSELWTKLLKNEKKLGMPKSSQILTEGNKDDKKEDDDDYDEGYKVSKNPRALIPC